ncbi:hypothetical protein [Rufibacter roseus]|uniref:ABC transporter ATPase n=1 Tax=Rufibacter roseus TaxID=1567108 RepID=A0ABW2DJ94_9BACT|nr:hypothetical protein [Rufibacter roseus]
MYVPFNELPPHSRIWVYQLSRPLTQEEEERMSRRLVDFVTEWSSHGNNLQASFEIRERHFLILATNEQVATASGCSIDKSVAFLRQLEQEFNVGFFDRTLVAFHQEGVVHTVPLPQMKKEVSEGALSPDTLYFNTLVATVGDLQNQWLVPAKNSWLARYF